MNVGHAADVVDPVRLAGLAALLDRAPPPADGVLPPLGHWLCFPPSAQQSELGGDGHPRRASDGLLPDNDLPRRMWAGSRIRFLADIPVGAAIERATTLLAATPKVGRSGRMLLATLHHTIAPVGGKVAIVEEQDIVYREAAIGPATRVSGDRGQPDAEQRTIVPDPMLLFRYSALTFNAHRIHYDRDYALSTEGYPSLVVHGPLIATLLLDNLLRNRPEIHVATFEFRAVAPAYEGEALTLGFTEGTADIALRAIGPDGVTMFARALARGIIARPYR